MILGHYITWTSITQPPSTKKGPDEQAEPRKPGPLYYAPHHPQRPWLSLWESARPFASPLGSPFGGERSEVAVVNDGPVDRQSRDRARRIQWTVRAATGRAAARWHGPAGAVTERVATCRYLEYVGPKKQRGHPLRQAVRPATSPIGRGKWVGRILGSGTKAPKGGNSLKGPDEQALFLISSPRA